MKGLAELVVSLCDLCEAEGRLLEAGILRTVRRVALLSLGLLFGAAALVLLLGALYALLTTLLPTPAALGLLGGASAAIAALLLWSARAGAAQEGREPRLEEGPVVGTSPPASAREHERPAPPKPADVQPPAAASAPWAEVAPYGHGASRDTSEPGKAENPAEVAGTQEIR